jgi:hypothetical protein
MGYYTWYEIEFDGKTEGSLVDAAIERVMANTYEWVSREDMADCLENQPYKWYEHNNDCCAISALVPEETITLSGEGEEQGDAWRNVYRGGACVEAYRGRLVFDRIT